MCRPLSRSLSCWSDVSGSNLCGMGQQSIFRSQERGRCIHGRTDCRPSRAEPDADGIWLRYKASQVGFKWYPDGNKKAMRKLFYAATTTKEPKGVCFFSVEIVPEAEALKVTSFGPMKLQSGSLPDWLK